MKIKLKSDKMTKSHALVGLNRSDVPSSFMEPILILRIFFADMARIKQRLRMIHGTENIKFNLDTPVDNKLSRITRFSGWCFSLDDIVFRGVTLTVNGNRFATLTPAQRLDVANAYPDYPTSAYAGFVGDLILPDWVTLGSIVEINLLALFADGSEILVHKREFLVAEEPCSFSERRRNYSLLELLQDPEKGKHIQQDTWPNEYGWNISRQILAGTPHFHPPGAAPIVRVLDAGPTHGYGARSLELIHALPEDSIFLDLGSGIKSDAQLFPNAVNLDAVHFANVDIVNSCEKLPFKDEVFDLVISQAVFEHLPSPFGMAKEIFRVLKPGGTVLIDTAFMQPLHGDPDHYFNMTSEGLRLVLEDFEIVELGVQPHQNPSYGLMMQINAVLPLIKKGIWKTRLLNFLNELESDGAQLDKDLGILGRLTMSAGVSAVARKPCEL